MNEAVSHRPGVSAAGHGEFDPTPPTDERSGEPSVLSGEATGTDTAMHFMAMIDSHPPDRVPGR